MFVMNNRKISGHLDTGFISIIVSVVVVVVVVVVV